jgi:hypothetical protein
MSDVHVSIRPAPGGWLLRSGWSEPLAFLSGATAEARAHHLARAVAGAGADAMVEVHDRSGALVGTTRYFGDAGPAAATDLSPSR